MPFGKRAVNVIRVIQDGGCPTRTLQRKEAVRQEAQRRVVVEAWPRATFEVVQPEFLLELLIALLHLPARLPDTNCVLEAGGCWQIGQRIADRAVAAPLDQQPTRFGGGVGHVRRRAAHAPAVRWPHPYPA